MNFADFLSLSNFVLGIPLPQVPSLDPNLAQTYFNLLTSNNVDISTLLATWHGIASQPQSQWATLFQKEIISSNTLWPQAIQVAMLWYTGIWDGGSANPALNSRNPALYERTLVWVLTQAHPMGVPVSFGYWQYPPSGANQ